jgi:hypothetical protein
LIATTLMVTTPLEVIGVGATGLLVLPLELLLPLQPHMPRPSVRTLAVTNFCKMLSPFLQGLSDKGALLISAAFMWPWPLPQNSEQAISNRPGGGATNSTMTGSPPLLGFARRSSGLVSKTRAPYPSIGTRAVPTYPPTLQWPLVRT